ncbi:MAG: acyltransferase [Acidimicrobiales bacterium]
MGAGSPPGHGGRVEVRALEGLRLVSALLIVFFHCQLVAQPARGTGAGTWVPRSGYLAVDFLFVLSGFAQFLPLAAIGPDRLPSWSGYALRRVARVVPAYWLACGATVLFVGSVTWGAGHAGRTVGVWEALLHLTFVHHIVYGISGQVGFGPNTALWTMTAEALFYLTLPFVAQAFLRHPAIGLLCGLAIAMSWRVFAVMIPGDLSFSIHLISQYPAFAFHFALGMTAATVVIRLREDPDGTGLTANAVAWCALAAALWGLAALTAWMRAADPRLTAFDQQSGYYIRWVWNLFPASAFAIVCVGVALAPPPVVGPLTNRVVRWLGEASYGTYLIHILVMLEIDRYWVSRGHRHHLDLWQIGTATAVVALVIGRFSFWIVEEPVRRLARRRHPAPSASQAVRRI